MGKNAHATEAAGFYRLANAARVEGHATLAIIATEAGDEHLAVAIAGDERASAIQRAIDVLEQGRACAGEDD